MIQKIKWLIRGVIRVLLTLLFIPIGPFEWATSSKASIKDVWKDWWDTWTMDWT